MVEITMRNKTRLSGYYIIDTQWTRAGLPLY